MLCPSFHLDKYKDYRRTLATYSRYISLVEIGYRSDQYVELSKALHQLNKKAIVHCQDLDISNEEELAVYHDVLDSLPLALALVNRREVADGLVEMGFGSKVVFSIDDLSVDDKNLQVRITNELARNHAYVKFTPPARKWSDNLRVLELAGTFKNAPLICHCTGVKSIFSRVMCSSSGSSALILDSPAPSGALKDELNLVSAVESYRIPDIEADWSVYGIAGSPVSHSLSPKFHNDVFRNSKLKKVYLPFETDDFDEFIEFAEKADIRGLSVTTPNKESAFAVSTQHDELSELSGATNTLLLTESGYACQNTDGPGFIKALSEEYGELSSARVLMIGAGGAGRAILHSLKDIAARIDITGKNQNKLKPVADALSVGLVEPGCYSCDYDIVINSTPVAHKEEDPEGFMEKATPASFVLGVDLHYAPEKPWFLRLAEFRGAGTMNGMPMFMMQARLQSEIWNRE